GGGKKIVQDPSEETCHDKQEQHVPGQSASLQVGGSGVGNAHGQRQGIVDKHRDPIQDSMLQQERSRPKARLESKAAIELVKIQIESRRVCRLRNDEHVLSRDNIERQQKRWK